MLSKLIKFVILTRFSKPLLALLTIIFVYNFFINTFVSTNFSLFVVLQYYGPGIIAFMLTLTTLSGGIVVLKSDRDYLFTLPLDKRELALSLYIAQFVASGLMIFYFFGFFSSAVAGMEYGRVLLVADLISLTLTVTSLSVVSNILPTRWRVLAGVLLAIWNLSAILGFAFAPASIFTGNVVNGSASIFALTAIVTVVAFRELEHVQLGTMRSLIRATSSEVKNMRSFAGMSPVRAIFSQNFSVLHFAGRMNMGGVSQYQTTSVPLTRVVLVTSVLAVVYGYVTMVFSPVTTLDNPIASVFPTFVLFFSFLTSQGGIANERAWLALTAMEPRLYFRYVSIARILALSTIISPFAAANMALALLGIDGMLVPTIPLLITIPCSIVIFVYWSSRVAPIQVKEEAPMMATQFNLSQMTTIIPFFFFVIAIQISTLLLVAALLVASVTLALTLLLLLNGKAWNELTEKLIEKGFV